MRDDDDNFETVFDRDGKPVRVLRDGKKMRVSMTMRDGSPYTVTASRVSDGSGNPLGLHRPGPRVENPRFMDVVNDARDQALRDATAAMTEAWRSPQQNGNDDDYGNEGAEGSVCTVRNAQFPMDFGSPGHVRNGICVPDLPRGPKYPLNGDSRSVSQVAQDHARNMAEVYALRDAELAAAWRRR